MRILAFRCVACLLCICLSLPRAAQSQGLGDDVETFLARMSPAERVGQLFMVGFPGASVEQYPSILGLIQKYRIGGVMLSGANGNLGPLETTGENLQALVAALQNVALSPGEAVSFTPTATATVPTETETPTAGAPVPTAAPSPTVIEQTPLARPVGEVPIPLFVAMSLDDMDWLTVEPDLRPTLSLMAIGATWDVDAAEQAGAIAGKTLGAVGINMLLGPAVDLSNPARAGLPGDLNARTFGESPFWVSVMAEAYVQGLRRGSDGSLLSVVTHFPGWGESDRDVFDETPVLQGSMEGHLQTDLLPFRRLVSARDDGISPIDGFVVSHVQFRSVTSATQMTRPASVDPQALQYFLALPEVKVWRAAGGLAVSDSLGASSVRRLYDPQGSDFQAKRVAYDSFLAGNDILVLDAMGTGGTDWEGHLRNVTDAVEFFQSKYVSDSAFRSRVDDSVRRILSAKLRLYGRFSAETVVAQAQQLEDWGEDWNDLSAIAGDAVTLIYPRLDEMVARLPAPPTTNDRVVIFEDARITSWCADCEPIQRPVSGTTFDLLQQLYGQQGSGHIDMTRVKSYTFAQLWDYVTSEGQGSDAYAALEQSISEANWLLFVSQNVAPGEPQSNALNSLLQRKPSLVAGKRIVAIVCGAPYYMDSTDIAKISAMFAVYSPDSRSIAAGLRALFREFAPTGRSPVSVPAVQYSIEDRVKPAADQMLYVEPIGDAPVGSAGAVRIGLGDDLALTTGLIKDQNGERVPDGTPVTFLFSYPAARIAWQQDSVTVDGKAQTTLRLDTSGVLEVKAVAGDARNTATLVVSIAEDKPAVISTIVPTPSPTAAPSATPPPVFPGDSLPTPEVQTRPLSMQAFVLTFLGLLGICMVIVAVGYQRRLGWLAAELALFAFCAGMCGYLAYGLAASSLSEIDWFHDLRGTLPWRWQSAILAWAVAGTAGFMGCWRPNVVGRATGLLRKHAEKEASQSKR